MKRKGLVSALIGTLLIGLVLVAVIKQRTSKGPVKVGSILVLSGDYKSLGEQIRDGQTRALEEINSEAARRLKLEIGFYDSQGEKSVALEKVKTLNRDGVRFIAEIFGSPSARHCLSYINEQDMLFVSGVDTGASLTREGGSNFFRIIPSDKLACQQLARRAINLGNTRAAIVYTNDEWGSGL